MEQRGGKVIPENKERVVRGTGARVANGKRNVRAGHGCIGSRDFWHSPSRTGMEWEDSLKTNSVREQSLMRHRNEVRGTESRDVCGGYLC